MFSGQTTITIGVSQLGQDVQPDKYVADRCNNSSSVVVRRIVLDQTHGTKNICHELRHATVTTRKELTMASMMDSIKAQIGICRGVVLTSNTKLSQAHIVAASHAPAAPKLTASRAMYQPTGTGR
jgi:hypothetical protein